MQHHKHFNMPCLAWYMLQDSIVHAAPQTLQHAVSSGPWQSSSSLGHAAGRDRPCTPSISKERCLNSADGICERTRTTGTVRSTDVCDGLRGAAQMTVAGTPKASVPSAGGLHAAAQL